MKDSYSNWLKAWSAGALLTMARAGCHEPGGTLIFGAGLMLAQACQMYIWTECVSVRGRYSPGSLASMLVWNLAGAHMAALALWACGWKGAPGKWALPWYAVGVLAIACGALEAMAYRLQKLPITFIVGAVIGAAGLPHCAAAELSVFSGRRIATVLLTYLAAAAGNRIGAGAWALIDDKKN